MGGASTGAARLFAAGVDHRSSTLELRDRIFIAEAELPGFHAELRRAGIAQAIVLSTCDRIEVLGAHEDPAAAAVAVHALLAARAAILIGEDELKKGAATVRDLDSGEQAEVPLAALKDRLAPYR